MKSCKEKKKIENLNCFKKLLISKAYTMLSKTFIKASYDFSAQQKNICKDVLKDWKNSFQEQNRT